MGIGSTKELVRFDIRSGELSKEGDSIFAGMGMFEFFNGECVPN